MHKPTITLAAVALTTFSSPQPKSGAPLQLQEERMTVEYVPATDRGAVRVEAESEEPLARVEVRDSRAATLFKLGASGGRGLALSGFTMETQEASLASLFETYGAGNYDIRARTVDGRPARGNAVLSHALLPEPALMYPPDGAVGVPTTLTVSWIPDPQAAGYRVMLEQGETDGLAVELPRGTSFFDVPAGVLQPGCASHVELGALGVEGNCTLVEAFFTTR